MSSFIPLEDISIASPCRADWSRMQGDERARFCGTCQKNVYNLSEMSRAEAEALLLEKEGKLCVRYYQRADGTIITDNCPVGLKLVRRPYKWLMAVTAAALAWGATSMGVQAKDDVPFMGDIAAPYPEPPAPKPTATPAPKPVVKMGKPQVKRTEHKREVHE